jgi:acetyltransferase-like isoleucine patch superfamily enzyme
MSSPKPGANDSLIKKAFWVLRHRRSQFFSQVRTYATFWIQRQWMRVSPIPGVTLDRNVRVQNRKALMVEAPNASISIGAHTLIYERAILEAFGNGQLRIGGDSILSDIRINCRGRITIGDRFLGSWNVFIQDAGTHPTDAAQRGLQCQITCRNFLPSWGDASDKNLPTLDWDPEPGTIEIGNDVWIGSSCTILKNVRIGDGCVVATGSVVIAGDYPPNSLIAGNPAKAIKTLENK